MKLYSFPILIAAVFLLALMLAGCGVVRDLPRYW
jgi:predicted small secreted protein